MATSNATLSDGRVLEIHRDMIEVTSFSPRPDKRWEFIDHAGHRHVWDDGWPTLRYVVDAPAYTMEDEDGYLEEYPETGHHECAICGEHIDPGLVAAPPYTEHIPGATTFLLDGEPISQDEAQALIEAERQGE